MTPATLFRRHWPLLQRALMLAFFALVLWLLARQLRGIAWAQVWTAIRAYDGLTLLLAALCSAASYLAYSMTDLFARVHFRLVLPVARAMKIAFVCYCFNINFGAWVGSVGFRYRLYSRFRFSTGDIARIVGFSVLTNWSGHLLLGGLCFLYCPIELPAGWELGRVGVQLLGAGELAVLLVYVAACGWSPRREWVIGGTRLALPGLRMALGQIVVSSINWLAIGVLLWVLMRQFLNFPEVMTTLVIIAVAGSITHVPGSLGVTEGVFLAVLGHRMPPADLLAALLVYRGLYYLVPLVVSAVFYAGLEAQAAREAKAAGGTRSAAIP